MVVIDPGIYHEALHLKDGVDLVFLGSDTLVTSSHGATLTVDYNANVHVYGNASFAHTRGAYPSITGSRSDDEYVPVVYGGHGPRSRLFLQFKSLENGAPGNSGRVVTWEGGVLHLVGERIANFGGPLACFDWDYSADLIDVDVAAIDAGGGPESIFITFQDNPQGDLYFRNTLMSAGGATIAYSGNTFTPRLVLVSVRLISDSQHGNINAFMEGMPIEVHMWDVQMRSGGGEHSILGGSDVMNLTLHTDVLADRPAGPTVRLLGPGQFLVRRGF